MNEPAPPNPDGSILSAFIGGPMDGLTEFARDNGPVRLFASPRISMDQIMRMSEADIPRADAEIPLREYAYRRTDDYTAAGARIFEYIGERTRQ